MKTKAEILEKFGIIDSCNEVHCLPDELYPAMDEYAQQQAQEFAEWIAKHGFIFTRHGWWNGPMFIYNTTPELYVIYEEEQKGG